MGSSYWHSDSYKKNQTDGRSHRKFNPTNIDTLDDLLIRIDSGAKVNLSKGASN
jgi:hypothetical protein